MNSQDTNPIKQYEVDYLQVDSLPSEGFPLYDKDDKIVVMFKQPEERHMNGRRVIISVTANQEDSYNLASRAVTSFRLYKEGLIGYKTEPDTKHPVLSGLPVRIPAQLRFDSYTIKSDELEFVRRICEQISTIEEKDKEARNKVVRLALSRFNRSYNEDNVEDVLVDLMICFEILFVGGRDEKAFQVRLLPALFLKNRGKKMDFVEMYYLLREAYDRRSKTVHEGQQFIDDSISVNYDGESHQFTRQTFFDKLRDYARLCLREYITKTVENRKTSWEMKTIIVNQVTEKLLK